MWFDALSHERVYKAAWSMEEIIAYFIQQQGKAFDSELITLFLHNIDGFFEINRRYKED